MLQIEAVEIIAGTDKSVPPFPEVQKDSLLTSELAEAISFRNLSLPNNADSLVLKISLYGKEAGALRQNKNQTLTAAFELSSGASRAESSLPALANSGEARNTMRLVFPVQNLRSRLAQLLPKFSNLEIEKSRGALLHVYETIEDGAQKAGSSQQIAKNPSASLDLSVHPNPFNPSTVIRFILPEENNELWALENLSGTVSVNDPLSTAPQSFRLLGNYPNPFNPRTVIAFELPEAAFVAVKIYNTQGRRIKILFEKFIAAGRQELLWEGTNQAGETVGSGVYFYTTQFGSLSQSGKMLLQR